MRAQGGGNGETRAYLSMFDLHLGAKISFFFPHHPDFAVQLISPQFDSLPQIKRHRMVNALLKEEFEEKGLHALSLKLRSQAEVDAELAKHGLGRLEDQLEPAREAEGTQVKAAGMAGSVVGDAGFDGHGNDVQHKT